MLTKPQIRKNFLQWRNNLEQQDVTAYSEQLSKFTKIFDNIAHNKIIASYMPHQNEINPSYLISNHQNIAYPRIIDSHKSEMKFKLTNDIDDLEIGHFGIREPKKHCRDVLPDIIIVPVIAICKNGYRIGYGKGYYDIAISKMHNMGHKPILIALCYHQQIIDKFSYDSHDIKMDYIISNQDILKL
jgi:5-formyltetrahydrofolate cyclo-ligase